MIDRYTKVLLTVIAVNLTVMVGWGAVKVLVPEVRAYDNTVYVEGGQLDRVEQVRQIWDVVSVKCRNC
jgi:hypothetical protein